MKRFKNIIAKYEDMLLSKIDRGLELSKEEIEDIIYYLKPVDTEEVSRGYELTTINSIIQLGDRFFLIEWSESCCAADVFSAQRPIEVIRTKKTIDIWEPIND